MGWIIVVVEVSKGEAVWRELIFALENELNEKPCLGRMVGGIRPRIGLTV